MAQAESKVSVTRSPSKPKPAGIVESEVKAAEGAGNGVNRVTRLLDEMIEFAGSTRGKLLSAVQNGDLRKIIVNELYRPGATVGDGGTSSILTKEFYEGSSTHLQKAQDRIKQLNDQEKSEKLGLNDLDILDA